MIPNTDRHMLAPSLHPHPRRTRAERPPPDLRRSRTVGAWRTLLPLAAGLALSLTAGTGPRAGGTAVYRPVIIGYSTVTSNPNHTDGNNSGGGPNNHPIMIHPDGSGQQYIHNVNYYGDLTHGGGARFVLDIQPYDVDPDITPTPGGSSLVAQSEDGTDGSPSYSQSVCEKGVVTAWLPT